MATEAQRKAMARYYQRTKKSLKTYVFKVDREKERDLVEHLESKSPKSQYIRAALRRDMERRNND